MWPSGEGGMWSGGLHLCPAGGHARHSALEVGVRALSVLVTATAARGYEESAEQHGALVAS